MKAAAITSFGGPEVLRMIDVETPQAGAGQVRVRVEAAGVQAYDRAVRAGWTPPGATITWLERAWAQRAPQHVAS